MFKDLKVLLSYEEYVRLDEEAKEKGMPTMIYIRRLLLGETDELATAYTEAAARAEALAPGAKFVLSSLFGEDWTQSDQLKRTLGKLFYKMVKNGMLPSVKALDENDPKVMEYERV